MSITRALGRAAPGALGRAVLPGVCRVLLLGLGCGAAAQDKTVQVKLSSWVPPAHPLNPALIARAADIEKEAGGTRKSTRFPSQQPSEAMDHYDMARDGNADLAYVNPGYQPGRFPIIAANELPFLIANAKGGSAAVDAWYRPYAAPETKDVHFCFAFVLDLDTWHSRTKKIVPPQDVRGMKIRPANATLGAFVTLLGGTDVPASAPEAREVLERCVADAITFPLQSTILFGIDQVVNYDMDMPFWTGTFVWVMNNAKYAAMSPAQRTVIDHHCATEWAKKSPDRRPIGNMPDAPGSWRSRGTRCTLGPGTTGRRAQGGRAAEGEMGVAGDGWRCSVCGVGSRAETAERAGSARQLHKTSPAMRAWAAKSGRRSRREAPRVRVLRRQVARPCRCLRKTLHPALRADISRTAGAVNRDGARHERS